MEHTPAPADLHLACVDCGDYFLFTAGEQAYFSATPPQHSQAVPSLP